MRSKLFVPGSRPELFDKAMNGPADCLSFDLEDSVDESRKGEARTRLAQFLRGLPERPAKTIIVRVNGLDTAHFQADVAAIVGPGVDLINVPKPESADEVRAAADVIERDQHDGRQRSVRKRCCPKRACWPITSASATFSQT